MRSKKPTTLSKNTRIDAIKGMQDIADFFTRMSEFCELVVGSMEERRIQVHRDRVKQEQLKLSDLVTLLMTYNSDIADVFSKSQIVKFHLGRLHAKLPDSESYKLCFLGKSLIASALEHKWGVPFRVVLEK